MQIAAAPQTKIEDYLTELRNRLRSLPADQIADIVEEIRSHLLDSAASGGEMTKAAIDSTLRQLGPPATLAASYLTDDLLARGRGRSWPWTILQAIFRWATLSVKGFLAFMVCTMGYAFGVSFFLVALLKPLFPKAGLWVTDPDSFSLVLGFTDAFPRGHELLGWTIIPIGLALGGGTILATTHFAWWCIGRFRQSRPAMRTGISAS